MLTLIVLIFAWWEGLHFLVLLAFVVGYATSRFGMFLGLNGREWASIVPLFLAAYIGSYIFMLHRARAYYRGPPPPPPPRKAEDDARYQPKSDSLVLDWFQQHGKDGPGG